MERSTKKCRLRPLEFNAKAIFRMVEPVFHVRCHPSVRRLPLVFYVKRQQIRDWSGRRRRADLIVCNYHETNTY